MANTLLIGDCLKVLKTFKSNSVDSIVTDPHYGLKFMGKRWDYDVPSIEVWKECLRVLKPGGHLLAFGGTRTYHRLVVNIEDAGFEIRDQIMWIYGSGFPKSMDISKAIDKEAGATRKVVGVNPHVVGRGANRSKDQAGGFGVSDDASITAPATEYAKKWSGYGTALKPANEPICLARKPLSEKTVAKNVLKHGTGGLNVDATRIGYASEADKNGAKIHHAGSSGSGTLNWNSGDTKDSSKEYYTPEGRFPANILFDEAAAAVLDEQSGILKSGARTKDYDNKGEVKAGHAGKKIQTSRCESSEGGASRFFYVAKASKKDRGEGNTHPTVKPVALMQYLIKLVTPEGGVVLDPFMGSGSTCLASKRLGFKYIGIEKDKKYLAIAKRRLKEQK